MAACPRRAAAPCPTAPASGAPCSPRRRSPPCDSRAVPQPVPAAALVSCPGCRARSPRPGRACGPRSSPGSRILLHASPQLLGSQDPATQGRGCCCQAPALTWGEALVPGEVTCPAALRLGFYSLQIETKPRRALPKPLTQHMAGRRDRAEQRRCCREADELGRCSSRSPGPRARALTPRTAAGEWGITLGSAGPPATLPAPACGWAGTVPPGSRSAPPAPASAGGAGGFLTHISGKWG